MAKASTADTSNASRKASSSKTSAKKAPAKKATAKKAPPKKATAKKATAKKATAKKVTASATAPSRSDRSKDKPVPAKKTPRPAKFKKVSRSVTRLVEPGSQVDCMHCGERVKFQAKMRNQQVICNVYEKHQWVRVDHYHADCYKLAKEPFGKPVD